MRWGYPEVVAAFAAILAAGLSFPRWGHALQVFLASQAPGMGPVVRDFVAGYGVQFVATVGAVWVFAPLLHRVRWSALGLRPAPGRALLRWGLGGGLVLFVLVLVAGMLLQRFHPQPQAVEQVLGQVRSGVEITVVMVILVVLAPFAEELFFRGFVYPVFRRSLGVWGGALCSGAFFGLAHWDAWRALPLALGGAALAYIYERSGSLYSCWLAHAVWNGAMGLTYFLASGGT